VIARVLLRTGNEDRELSVEQFLKLPLDKRIQMILEQHVSFFDEQKQLMDRQEALKELRTWRRS
jgi:hypothetical protein